MKIVEFKKPFVMSIEGDIVRIQSKSLYLFSEIV